MNPGEVSHRVNSLKKLSVSKAKRRKSGMIGIDLLALADHRFIIKPRQIPEGWAIGVMDDPFGDVLPKLKKLLDSGRFPACRIHAHWADNHAIVPISKLKKKLPRYEELAKQYPEVKFYISHSCEYKEPSAKKVRQRIDLIKQLAPSCIPVNSCASGATLANVITERHGNVYAGELLSMDGTDITEMNIKTWLKRNVAATACFIWRTQFNGRNPGEAAIPIKLRKHWPTKEQIKELVDAAR